MAVIRALLCGAYSLAEGSKEQYLIARLGFFIIPVQQHFEWLNTLKLEASLHRE